MLMSSKIKSGTRFMADVKASVPLGTTRTRCPASFNIPDSNCRFAGVSSTTRISAPCAFTRGDTRELERSGSKLQRPPSEHCGAEPAAIRAQLEEYSPPLRPCKSAEREPTHISLHALRCEFCLRECVKRGRLAECVTRELGRFRVHERLCAPQIGTNPLA